jgi:integrase
MFEDWETVWIQWNWNDSFSRFRFTAAGFGNWFRDRCNEAGLPQYSAHGLRKVAATRLANAGCSSEMIKAITGHRSDSALAPYIRAAQQTRLARQAKELERLAEQGMARREQKDVKQLG